MIEVNVCRNIKLIYVANLKTKLKVCKYILLNLLITFKMANRNY